MKRKYFLKKLSVFLFLFFVVAFFGKLSVLASDLTSTNFIIKDPIVGTGGGYGESTNFKLISAGHTLLSGVGSSASFITHYGFLYYQDQVAGTITFDIDTDTADTDTNAPYTVSLGTLTTSAVTRSNGSVKSIWTNLETNATSGAVVTVVSTSLHSASVPTDTIPSATTTMAAGTANYGLCVAATSADTGTYQAVSPYNGGTCVDGAVNTVGIVDGTARSILNTSSAAMTGGRSQIRVNATISPTTPAHSDYTDSLTFIATGTF